jgi:hypothetical protein
MICPTVWPTNTVTENEKTPHNMVIWAPDQGVGQTLTARDENDAEVQFTDAGLGVLRVHGSARRGYALPINRTGSCFSVEDPAQGRAFFCAGRDDDNEPPIDPVLSADLGLPKFGSRSANDEARQQESCFGGGATDGNLVVQVEADESGNLLLRIQVLHQGEVILDDARSMFGQRTVRYDVGEKSPLTVRAHFIDQAGNFGEIAEVEVTAPLRGCSHSGAALWLLAGLLGLRRRR